jgi:hypothetical protein
MSDEANNQNNNPLEDYAAAASEALDGAPVELNQTTTDSVEGGQVWMKDSAARSVEANAVHLEDSAAGFVHASSVEARESAIGVAVTREARLTDTTNSFIVAQNVEAENVRTIALIAGQVDGEVQTLLTPMTAMAAGAGFALALWLFKQLFTRLNPFVRR